MSKILVLNCEGSPYEIGLRHGEGARQHIKRSIVFYAQMFEETSRLSWDEVQEIATSFAPTIQQSWPAFYEEIKGVAHGSESSVLEILALNVRTEIAFGRFSDGCTSLAWHTSQSSFLSQNWDWKPAQKENLIILKMKQAGKPSIQMVTEAGLIGKIGLNSEGVGVCLNAIKARGVDEQRIPVHLALRMALESRTASEAVQQLETSGVASAAHILVADPTTAVGLEVSAKTIEKVHPDLQGRLTHTNHFKLRHTGVIDAGLLSDSEPRERRLLQLTSTTGEPTYETLANIYQDKANAPTAICRQQIGISTLETLFNIIMDLRKRVAEVSLGRPSDFEERITLAFS